MKLECNIFFFISQEEILRETHVSKGVQVIVGEFELLKGNKLAAPVRSSGRGVRMDVQPAGHGGLCLSRDGPK